MDTQKIQELAKKLEHLMLTKGKVELAIADLNFKGHQKPLFVKIGDLGVNVTDCSYSNGYMSKVRRGYEMIHLGCKKVYQGELDELNRVIEKVEGELRALTEIKG